MKICHIIFSFTIGGAETMLVDIINEQVKTENVSLIIVNNLINENLINTINSQVNIIRINRIPSSKNPIPILKINQKLLKINPNIIHCHESKGINLLLPHYKKKAVLTVHNTTTSQTFLLRKYKGLFAISKTVKQDIFRKYNLNSKVIYNGIAISRIKTKNSKSENSTFRIVQVGRLKHIHKGQHLLIQAIRQLVYDHRKTNFHVDFIGDGESFLFLNKLVNDYNLGNYITFLGEKDRDYVYEHLCEYDLLIQPSLCEGFGLTVVEAMAAKISVLVSANEGPMEIIEDGKYGCYFNIENEKELSQKILFIEAYYNDNENRQMIENAYQYVIMNFDIKNTALNYINAYILILKKNMYA